MTDTSPLFNKPTAPKRTPRKQSPPPPAEHCGFPINHSVIPVRCMEIGPYTVRVGWIERRGVCEAHLAGVVDAYGELGLKCETTKGNK